MDFEPIYRRVLGGVLAVISFLSSVGLWIHFFDSGGGEPGSATIFSLIPFLPVVVVLMAILIWACGRSRRTTQWVAVVTGILFVGVLASTVVSRVQGG